MKNLEKNKNGRRKNEILLVAQEIFSDKGLTNTNVADIARKANVTDSVLYHYFKNKEDLLFASLAEKMLDGIEELELHLEGIVGALPKLGKMIWFHLYVNDRSPVSTSITKNLLFECRSNKKFYDHDGYKMLGSYVHIVRDILKEGVEDGSFSRNLNIRLVSEMIFGLLDEESINCFVSHEVKETLPDLPGITDLVLAMVGCDDNTCEELPPENDEKKSRLLRSAEKVFAERGYHAATISEIAKRANVAEGTIYTHFKNKEDLLFSISKRRFVQLKNEITDVFRLENPLKKLQCMIRFNFSMFLSNRNFLNVFLLDNKLNRDFYKSPAYHDFLSYLSTLEKLLEEGKEAGVFRKEVDNRLFRNLFVGTFCHTSLRWFVLRKTESFDIIQEIEEIIYLLCRAVLHKDVLPSFKLDTYQF